MRVIYNLLNPLLDPFSFLLLSISNTSNSAIKIVGYKTFGLLFPQDKFREVEWIGQWACTLLQGFVWFV